MVGAIERGIHSASQDAQLIAWNWSWSYYQAPPQSELIPLLPASAAVMVDFERRWNSSSRFEQQGNLNPR